jgi:hypothetical protein
LKEQSNGVGSQTAPRRSISEFSNFGTSNTAHARIVRSKIRRFVPTSLNGTIAFLRQSLGKPANITGHSLRRAQEILEKYLARTSRLAENAIAKFEKNRLETDFAKRPAKRDDQSDAK